MKFIKSGKMNIEQMKDKNRSLGHHFFNVDSMKYFKSKIVSGTNEWGLFVTSEKGSHMTKRAYTVRYMDEDGRVETLFDFCGFTKHMAFATMERLTGALNKANFGNREKTILENIYKINFAEDYPKCYEFVAFNDNEDTFILHEDGRIVG